VTYPVREGVSQFGRLYGRLVSSEVDLGFGISRPSGSALSFRVGRCRPVSDEPPIGDLLAERFDPEFGRFYTATRCADGYVLRFHQRFDFIVSPDLDVISVDWDPRVDLDLAAVYFAGTVMSFLFGLEGRLTLHASAVACPLGISATTGAVAIFGESGAGKTTLAALCVASGAEFLSDDLLLVDFESESPTASGRGTELRLRSESTWVLCQYAVHPETRPTPDGRTAICPPPPKSESRDYPIRALVRPELVSNDSPLSLTRLLPAEAFLELARVPRLAGWTTAAVLGRQFEAMADLAERVPCYVARIPWSTSSRPRAGSELLRAVSEALARDVPALG
jgi:hypothetical protein